MEYETEELMEQVREEREARGMERGVQQGIQQGIQALYTTLRDMNVPEEQILETVAEKFRLSKEEALKYMKQ